MNSAADFNRALHVARAEIDTAIEAYRKAIHEDAIADDDARKAKARAYVQGKAQLGSKATVPELAAYVDLETSNQQYEARLREGLKRAAGQALESKMRWLQALQSEASLVKSEMNLARYEPSEVAS